MFRWSGRLIWEGSVAEWLKEGLQETSSIKPNNQSLITHYTMPECVCVLVCVLGGGAPRAEVGWKHFSDDLHITLHQVVFQNHYFRNPSVKKVFEAGGEGIFFPNWKEYTRELQKKNGQLGYGDYNHTYILVLSVVTPKFWQHYWMHPCFSVLSFCPMLSLLPYHHRSSCVCNDLQRKALRKIGHWQLNQPVGKESCYHVWMGLFSCF